MATFDGVISENDFFQIVSDGKYNNTHLGVYFMNDTTGNWSNIRESSFAYFTNYVIFVAGVLITSLTIVGNVLVIIAVISEKRLRKVGNIFIINLAVSDCLVGAVVSPLAIHYDISGRWSLGELLCDVWVSLDVICCTASILNLCAIAYDRFKAIVEPMKYSRKRTLTRALIVVVFVWVYSVLIALPRHVGWRRGNEYHLPGGQCVISREMGYTIYSTFGAFFVPLMFMLYFYYQIYCATCFRRSQWHISKGHRTFIDTDLSKQQSGCSCVLFHQLLCSESAGKATVPDTLEQGTQTAKPETNFVNNPECLDDVEETENRRESIEPELLAIYQMRHRSNRIFSNITIGSSSTYYSSTDSSNTATTSFSESSDRGSCKYSEGFGRDRCSSTSTEGSQIFIGTEFGVRRLSAMRSHRLSCARQSSLHTEVIHEVASAYKLDQSDESEPEIDDPPGSKLMQEQPVNQESEDMNDNEDTSDAEEPTKRKTVRKLRSSTFRRRNSRKSKRIAISQEKRAARTLGIVMGCFIVCWLPFFIVAFLRAVCEQCYFPALLLQVVCWLGYFNSACNPFIYTFFNSDFKKAFKKMLQSLYPKRQVAHV